jgi:hypothetical protein
MRIVIKNISLFSFCWILLVGCGSENPKTNETTEVKLSSADSLKQALKDEVMVVHDDAMAKMGMLYDLEIAVKNATDSTQIESVEQAEEIIGKLQISNKDMMDWMRQYKDPEFEDENKLKQYFKSQMASITKVKVNTDSSIFQADEFLEASKKK